ncbi:MBL fold metallo-hydrolase [Curtobacterium sp. S6]|uniref:MBL fold metallo-hydrolase n=1 Tax=Curtobacterium sp. S6 TaxID=1479623 RepID=UPI0004AB6AD5|nr:MBL fold metallo-hydrolase [Curtobacterium sp. S6]
MELKVIGCTGSFAGPDSPASCYLLTSTDGAGRTWRVLLDMGSGSLGELQKHLDLSEIDAVLISHLHPDHCVDLAGFYIAARWDPRGWKGGQISVWAPAGMGDYLARTHSMPSADILKDQIDFHDWAEHTPVTIGPFTIEPYRVLHPIEEPYALRVTEKTADGETVLTYSGDSDACEGLTRSAREADVFLCEAAYMEGRDDAIRGIHLTGARAGQTAHDAGARRLLLTHLPIWNDPETALAEARQYFAGPIDVVTPLGHYTV